MKWKHLVLHAKRAYAKYDSFMEKQGFGIVLMVCVLIILASAIYTFHFRQVPEQQGSMQEMSVEAGTQEAQTLLEAQKLVSSTGMQAAMPTNVPFEFIPPVDGFLERDFSVTEPQYFPAANYYRLHTGIDLQVGYGTAVQSASDGKVLAVWQDNELGQSIRIRHDNGYEAVYAGLSDASYVQSGDPVRKGQTIGHTGNGVLAESDEQPHLHFEVWLGSTPVDPVEMFLGLTR